MSWGEFHRGHLPGEELFRGDYSEVIVRGKSRGNSRGEDFMEEGRGAIVWVGSCPGKNVGIP